MGDGLRRQRVTHQRRLMEMRTSRAQLGTEELVQPRRRELVDAYPAELGDKGGCRASGGS